MSGSAGASATVEGSSGSGGSSDGAGGAGLGGAPSGSGGLNEGTGGAEVGTGGSAGSTPTSCDDGTDWDFDWQQLECDAIALINERRATGYNCGSGYGFVGPVGSVARHQLLTETVREHLQTSVQEYDCFDPFLSRGDGSAVRRIASEASAYVA